MDRHTVLSLAATVLMAIGGSVRAAGQSEACDEATTVELDGFMADLDSGRWPADLPQASPSEIIVKFAPGVPRTSRDAILERHACSIVGSCDAGGFQLVRISEWQSPEQMVATFQEDPAVEYAEPDYYAGASFIPDDRYYPFQWNLHDGSAAGIHMEGAWDIQRGRSQVIIAVLDTGVAYEDFGDYRQAPDLAQTSFVGGYDFVNEDRHPNDDQGHGTHVTGTIAQSTDNERGVAGVAFGCSIMPVKVLDAEGIGGHFRIARGIFFAVENGATVINMSLGSPQDSRTLRDAMATAYRQGVTIVCAAGNEFLAGNPRVYPAAYDDYCIAVGAVRYDAKRARYSATGPQIDVVAPGGDLLVDQNADDYGDGILQQTFSTEPNVFGYWFFQGTSMATPHVSGLAALLASRGVAGPDSIRQAIERTARDLGQPGRDNEYGWGLIDAQAALAYYVQGDLDGDGIVALQDLSVFSDQWLAPNRFEPLGDLNGDRRVDFADLALLGSHWDR